MKSVARPSWITICIGIVTGMLAPMGCAFGQQPKVATNKPQSRWHSSSKKNEMDRIVITTLSLDSSNSGGVGGLIIRCGGYKAEIYVYLGDYAQPELGGGHTVRVKFDSEEPRTENWGESTNSQGLFSPFPLSLLHKLLSTQKFLFEFTPYEKQKKVFSFDLFGLSRALTPETAKSCGQLHGEGDPYSSEHAR